MSRRLVPPSPYRSGRSRPLLRQPARRIDVRRDLIELPARPTVDAEPSLIEENATLARELARVQQRCTDWRDRCIVQADRLEAALMRSRAAAMVKETQLASLRDAFDALQKRAAVWLTNEELVRRLSDLRARNRSLEAELAELRGATVVPSTARTTSEPEPACEPEPSTPAPSALGRRRVLCVGGRARQTPVYRALVENNGGEFAHADGTSDADIRQLERELVKSDIVILQAGYACQEACQAVEAHCARTGTRCIWLDKPCVRGFVQGLTQALAPVSTASNP